MRGPRRCAGSPHRRPRRARSRPLEQMLPRPQGFAPGLGGLAEGLVDLGGLTAALVEDGDLFADLARVRLRVRVRVRVWDGARGEG